MSVIQFSPENIASFYGTTQYECVPLLTFTPVQILGLVPCEFETDDCRNNPCLNMTVFNGDFSRFLFQYNSQLGLQDAYKLDQFDSSTDSWTEIAVLQNNTHGEKFDIGFDTNYPLYGGFALDWEKVQNLFGNGVYRFRLENITLVGFDLISPAYELRTFTCEAADNTVKIVTDEVGKFYNWKYKKDSNSLQSYNSVSYTHLRAHET